MRVANASSDPEIGEVFENYTAVTVRNVYSNLNHFIIFLVGTSLDQHCFSFKDFCITGQVCEEDRHVFDRSAIRFGQQPEKIQNYCYTSTRHHKKESTPPDQSHSRQERRAHDTSNESIGEARERHGPSTDRIGKYF